MSKYSSNLNRQFYVVKDVKTAADPSVLGDIRVKETADKKAIYFLYKDQDAVKRSPLIVKSQIIKMAAKDGVDRANVAAKVVLNGSVIAGQDYLLKATIKQHISLSELDEYYKDAVVRGISGMTASAFYKKMAVVFARSLSRECWPLLNVYLQDADTATTLYPVIVDGERSYDISGNLPAATEDKVTADKIAGIIIEEAAQDFKVGFMPRVPVMFSVHCGEIVSAGVDTVWGTVTMTDMDTINCASYKGAPKHAIKNAYDLQDIERFCIMEQGNKYQEFDHELTKIPVELMIDLSKTYDTIDMHYYFVDSLGGVQKSESDITFAMDNATNHALRTALKNAINGALQTNLPAASYTVVNDTIAAGAIGKIGEGIA